MYTFRLLNLRFIVDIQYTYDRQWDQVRYVDQDMMSGKSAYKTYAFGLELWVLHTFYFR